MSTASVNIVTLLKQDQKEKGRYALSFDIVQKKKTDIFIKKRKAEGYVEDSCILSCTSPVIELPLKDSKCSIKFELAGALQPDMAMSKGEDVIVYNDKGQSESRRELLTVPKYDQTGSSTETAAVIFYANGEFKHKVTITDIPTNSPGQLHRLSSTSSSFVSVSGASRQGSLASQMSAIGLEDPNNAEFTQVADASYSGGSTSYDNGAKNQALPSYPGPTVVPNNASQGTSGTRPTFRLGSDGDGGNINDGGGGGGGKIASGGGIRGHGGRGERGDQLPDGSSSFTADDSGYGPLLENESLRALAMAITPNDFNLLITLLGVQNAVYAIAKKNHPGDIGEANYQALVHWRSGSGGKASEVGGWQKRLVEELLQALAEMKRNDIRGTIFRKLESGPTPLTLSDFAHL